MADIPQPIGIIMCGKNAGVGALISRDLSPEIFTYHFLTPDDPIPNTVQLAHLLHPSSPIQAIVLGAGFTEDVRNELRAELVDKPGIKQVHWLAADLNVVKHIGPDKPPQTGAEVAWYAQQAAARVKKCIGEMKEKGIWKGEMGGDANVYFY